MNTRGSVRELPKVQAAVVSSRAPAARSHQHSQIQQLSSGGHTGGQLARHEAAAPASSWREQCWRPIYHTVKRGNHRAVLAMNALSVSPCAPVPALAMNAEMQCQKNCMTFSCRITESIPGATDH